MSATWYLVQFVPDFRRREPRNVGLILNAPDQWFVRFLGELDSGKVDGRSVVGKGIDPEVYRTWVRYFHRKAADQHWEDIDRLQRRRKGNFRAELGGHILTADEPWADLFEKLFSELVEPKLLDGRDVAESSIAVSMVDTARRVLERAGISVRRQVQVNAQYWRDGPTTTVPFHFSYVNGQQHLMDVAHTHKRLDLVAADIRDLRARIDAALLAGSATSFISFYSSEILSHGNLDELLLPIERVSFPVDIDADNAADTVLEVAGGHD